MAAAAGIAGVAAGTGIHRRHQLKLRGKLAGAFEPRQHHHPALQGLAQRFQALRGNSGNSSRNSTPRCASDNSPGRIALPPINAADGTVCWGLRNGRRRPPSGGGARQRFQARRLPALRSRSEAAAVPAALREQGLARPGRPDHQQPVLAGGGDFQGALRRELAATSARSGRPVRGLRGAMRDGALERLRTPFECIAYLPRQTARQHERAPR
jgi:hypothetical protein